MTETTNSNSVKQEAVMTIDVSGVICPFIVRPLEGCYCTSTNSIHAEDTIYYCGGHFEKCDIYSRNTGKARS